MDENNLYHFDIEPENGGEQPTPAAAPAPQKKGTGKLVALVAAVAVLAAAGGAALSHGISMIRGGNEITEDPVPAVTQETEPSYELSEHKLPETLPTNDAGRALSLTEIYEMTVNSVVGIKTEAKINVFGQEAVSASAGSGFILSSDGYIITNAHVVKDADTIEVQLYNGETYEATLEGKDTSFDIAVLKIDGENLPAVSVADSDTLKVGEEVVAIGNPLGELTFTMTNGILSALDREINIDGNPQNMLQTNAAINSGNSGGPLFNTDGNVIGVTSVKYSGTSASGTNIEGLGFAIPINEALRVAYDLMEHGYVRGQAYLGITVATLNEEVAAYYSLPRGPRVEEIVPGSCAERYGLQVGDIIFKVNDTETETHTAVVAALKKLRAGDTVELSVFRAGAEMTVSVVLDEKPRSMMD